MIYIPTISSNKSDERLFLGYLGIVDEQQLIFLKETDMETVSREKNETSQ